MLDKPFFNKKDSQNNQTTNWNLEVESRCGLLMSYDKSGGTLTNKKAFHYINMLIYKDLFIPSWLSTSIAFIRFPTTPQ